MEVVNANGGDYTTTPGNIKWTISEIQRESAEYTITYTLRVRDVTYNTGVTTIRNSVDITSTTTGTQDSDYNNNFDETTVSVNVLPDLKIEKTVDKPTLSVPANENGTLTYTLTVSNTGKVNHTGAYTVTDYLPVGVTYVSSNPNATTIDNGTITWELSDALNANSGTIKTFVIIVSGIGYSLAGDILENRATVYSTGTNDADDSDNEDTAETYVYPNVWVGISSTDWNTEDNWTYGIPGADNIKTMWFLLQKSITQRQRIYLNLGRLRII